MYLAGFFLTVSVESMLKVTKYCVQNNRTYCQDFGKLGVVVVTMDETMFLRGGNGEHDVARRVEPIRERIEDTSSEDGKTCQWSRCPLEDQV